MQRRNFFKWAGGVLAALGALPGLPRHMRGGGAGDGRETVDAADVVIEPVSDGFEPELCFVYTPIAGALSRTYFVDYSAKVDGDGSPLSPFNRIPQEARAGDQFVIKPRGEFNYRG